MTAAISKRGRYYDPPTSIRTIEGVEHRQCGTLHDEYLGRADALDAAGILARRLFPGEPEILGRIASRPGP